MPDYEVVVSNIGTVYRGHNFVQAMEAYNHYREMSGGGGGRAGGQDVTLFRDGDLSAEFIGFHTRSQDEVNLHDLNQPGAMPEMPPPTVPDLPTGPDESLDRALNAMGCRTVDREPDAAITPAFFVGRVMVTTDLNEEVEMVVFQDPDTGCLVAFEEHRLDCSFNLISNPYEPGQIFITPPPPKESAQPQPTPPERVHRRIRVRSRNERRADH